MAKEWNRGGYVCSTTLSYKGVCFHHDSTRYHLHRIASWDYGDSLCDG